MSRLFPHKAATRADSALIPGNRITVLTNGDEIFPEMLKAIRNAQSSIVFLTYVYWRGDIADEFAHALCDKALEGVEVTVLIDAFGGNKIDTNLVKRMRQSGVSLRWFRPLRWYTLHKYNNRTHRKILVVDQQIGFVGGVGIADEWTGNAHDTKHWRDTHFKVTGNAALELIKSFNANWVEAGGAAVLTGEATKPLKTNTVAIRVTSSRHARRRTRGDVLYYQAITNAKKNITITTAYFAPSSRFILALMAASRRGVAVTILTNGPYTNQYLARKAGHHIYTRLLVAGVSIYEYQKTLLHAKIMTIDDNYAIVGSINFDDRSFVLNDEICISFTDRKVVAELDAQFKKDIADSRHINLPHWQARAFRSKLVERCIALVLRGQL